MLKVSQAIQTTALELECLPDDGIRRELVNGVIKMMSPAGGEHGEVAHRLGRYLGNFVESAGLGVVFASETGFILTRDPDTVRAPDVAYVKQERLEGLGPLRGFVPLAPDLVAEVVSPSDSYSDVEEKTAFWIRSGVLIVLIVDPANEIVRICRSGGEMELFRMGDELRVEDVLPGWSMSVASLFRRNEHSA